MTTLLDVRGVTKRFGGLVANQDVSFAVAPGEIVGVIDPNGAGKSTLFDVITGFHRPDAGEVRLAGRAITGRRPDEVNRLGIARTFQNLRPFGAMSVRENVMGGALRHEPEPRAAHRTAERCLALGGLGDNQDAFARELSTGQRKRLGWPRPWRPGPACSCSTRSRVASIRAPFRASWP